MSKDARLHLRLSSEELTLVKDAAGRAGKPVSRYVRDVVLSDAEVDQVIPAVVVDEGPVIIRDIRPSGEIVTLAKPVSRNVTCPNAAFHRKGSYCKRCGGMG